MGTHLHFGSIKKNRRKRKKKQQTTKKPQRPREFREKYFHFQ